MPASHIRPGQDQEQKHSTPLVWGVEVSAKAAQRARELHQRADQMFRAGYQASAWKLREQAWRVEGRA